MFQVANNHVSVLILALFNASINEDELTKDYSYDATSRSW